MRGFLVWLSLALINPALAGAQLVSAGVVGGAALTDDFRNLTFLLPTYSSLSYSTSKSYVIGPSVEVELPLNLSVEADALYHPLHFTNAIRFPNGTLNSVSPATVVTWEFPILAKYRFPLPLVKSFGEVGPSFRTSGNLNNTAPASHGLTIGIGGETGWHRLKIAPVIRYTHWASDGFALDAFTKQDQVTLLLSLTF